MTMAIFGAFLVRLTKNLGLYLATKARFCSNSIVTGLYRLSISAEKIPHFFLAMSKIVRTFAPEKGRRRGRETPPLSA